MKQELTTMTIFRKDKKKFKDIINKYDLNQQEGFGRMVKIIKKFDPEMRDMK